MNETDAGAACTVGGGVARAQAPSRTRVDPTRAMRGMAQGRQRPSRRRQRCRKNAAWTGVCAKACRDRLVACQPTEDTSAIALLHPGRVAGLELRRADD